jgi:hypothetical protein
MLGLGALPGAPEKAVDNGKGDRRVYFKYGVSLERVHIDDGQGGRGRYGTYEFLIGKLVYRGHMDMDHGPEVRGQGGGGQTGKSLMHDGDCTYLFLGEFIGPFEVIDFDLPGISGGPENLRFGVPGIYCGEELIYLFLGQNFCHYL